VASESKLFACASKVVRIVSLTKHFWTKLEDVGGKGVLFNSAKGQNLTNHRATGPVITACLHRLMESITTFTRVVQRTFPLYLKNTCLSLSFTQHNMEYGLSEILVSTSNSMYQWAFDGIEIS